MNSLLPRLFFFTRVSSIVRRFWAQRRRFVVMFHGISARKHDQIPRDIQPYLSSADLDRILQWIRPRFAFLSPQEFFRTKKPGILLTFDDGFSNNEINALPVLERYQAPAIFFVTAQHVINPRNWLPAARHSALKYWGSIAEVDDALAVDFFDGMSMDQLRHCANHPLITIGSHTLSHPFLTQSDPVTLAFELSESKRLLESLTQKSMDYFAYPTGDYDLPVMEAVKNAGHHAAFAVDTKHLGSPLFEIPRVGLYNSDAAYLDLKLSGLHRPPLSVNKFQSGL